MSPMKQQPMNIFVDSDQQRAFRRRAVSAFHKNQEYMEAIFIRRGVGEFHVVKFIKLKLIKQGPEIVDSDDVQYNALKNEAKNLGLEFGTIHTHLYNDTAPSEWDHKEGLVEGEALVGVCSVWTDEQTGKTHSRIGFWQPQHPCALHVVKS